MILQLQTSEISSRNKQHEHKQADRQIDTTIYQGRSTLLSLGVRTTFQRPENEHRQTEK